MIIAITGEMGSGKSTAAKIIAQLTDGEIMPFAGPLKDIARSIGWNGEKNKKGRRLLQLLGTEICRECIDPNWHIKRWKLEVELMKSVQPNMTIISDDLRFLNEAEAVALYPSVIIKMVGRRCGIVQSKWAVLKQRFKRKHRSESELAKIVPHITIDNSNDIKWLYRELAILFDEGVFSSSNPTK